MSEKGIPDVLPPCLQRPEAGGGGRVEVGQGPNGLGLETLRKKKK